MRKFIAFILSTFLFITQACANGGYQGGYKSSISGSGNKIISGLPMNGLMSYKNAEDNPDVPKDLDYSLGSATNTLTVSRSATYPSTYLDKDGKTTLCDTSDIARRTMGYWNETGWHYDPHWLLEGASTNYVLNGHFSIDYNSDGLSDSWSRGTATVVKYTRETCAVNGLANGKSQKFVAAFDAEPVRYTGLLTTSTANDTFDATSANIPVTVSFWARGDFSGITTGRSVGSWVQCEADDNAGTFQQFVFNSRSIENSVTDLSATEWRRFSYTGTITDIDSRKVRLRFGYFSAADGLRPQAGESCWLEVYGVQIEKQLYPSSYIPTTTAALTRNAETTNTYTTAGNFPAPSGGNCLSFDGTATGGDDYVSIPNSATGNQYTGSTSFSIETWCFIRSAGEGDLGRIIGKSSSDTVEHMLYVASTSGNYAVLTWVIKRDALDSQVQCTSSTIPLNTWIHVLCTWADGEAPKMYYNSTDISSPVGSGSIIGSGNILDDSARNLIIGNRNNASTYDRTFDGFIQTVRIYRDKALSAAEVATLYNAGRGTAIANIPSVTGCTAEYLFNEGTGSTLTDTVAANNGTISGATWSKDTMSGSIMLKYMPIMLPNEQVSSYLSFFLVDFINNNNLRLITGTNASNSLILTGRSNNNAYDASSSALTTWTRYASHTLIATWSTTADGSGKKLNFYIDGVLVGSNANFAVPAGALPGTFEIQPSSGQAMGLKEMAVWNRVLTQAEVTQIQNRS
jgi:hypothetical protein